MSDFGMHRHVRSGSEEMGPVLKPTGFMESAWNTMEELERRCDGSHEHVSLMGGRAAKAAIYPPKLCSSICKGLKAQIELNLHVR